MNWNKNRNNKNKYCWDNKTRAASWGKRFRNIDTTVPNLTREKRKLIPILDMRNGMRFWEGNIQPWLELLLFQERSRQTKAWGKKGKNEGKKEEERQGNKGRKIKQERNKSKWLNRCKISNETILFKY